MALERLNDDLSVISKLGTNPGIDDGLSEERLKAKFDEAVNIIKLFLNEKLIPSLEMSVDTETITKNIQEVRTIAESKTLKKERTATLSSSGWSNLQQTVSVDGVTADNTVIPVAAPASYMPYLENSVRCVAQAAGNLTFQCATVPTANVSVNILILE